MNRIVRVTLLVAAAAVFGCRSTTTPPPPEDAGIYLPTAQGNSWVYAMAAGNNTFRTLLSDTTVAGRIYHVIKDSTTIPPDTSYVGLSFVRSDENKIYSVVSMDPLVEEVALDTRVAAAWSFFADSTMTVLPTLSNFKTVALLPSFTVNGKTYPDVLQIEETDSYPGHPSYGSTTYELYYAKTVGLVEVLDSTDHIISESLQSYHVN